MCDLSLFSIYQNNTWTIKCLADETIDPATQRPSDPAYYIEDCRIFRNDTFPLNQIMQWIVSNWLSYLTTTPFPNNFLCMANLLLNRAKKAKHDPAVSTLLPSVVSLYFYLSQLDLCLKSSFLLTTKKEILAYTKVACSHLNPIPTRLWRGIFWFFFPLALVI